MNPNAILAVTALLLAGCAGTKSFSAFEPATPPDYSGPTANVADQVLAVGPQRLHVFEMTEVDGRRLSSSSMASARAGKGSSMTLTPVALTNELPLRPARVRLQATTQYASPMLALSQPTCRAAGEVDFTPEAGRAYRVAGRIAPQACEAWIEDVATQQPVTDKVGGKGTGP